jgi:hypothetical protein
VVGQCNPQTITVDPDPKFPEAPVPLPTLPDPTVDFAIYAREQTFSDLLSKELLARVPVSEGGGGLIRWEISGTASLDPSGQPIVAVQTAQGELGVFTASDVANVDSEVSAWNDGPSGLRLSLDLSEMNVVGDFVADFDVAATIAKTGSVGEIDANLVVQSCSRTAAGLFPGGGPLIDKVVTPIIDSIAQDQLDTLAGTIARISRTLVLGLKLKYLKTVKPLKLATGYAEGLAKVSAFVAVYRKNPLDAD